MRPGFGALKAGYFSYFAAVGVFQPYWSVQLSAQGFSAASIGTLLAAVSAARIVAPLAHARLADYVGDDSRSLALAATLAAAVVPMLAATRDFPTALALTLVFALCFNGLMPVYDALALRRLGLDSYRYGRLRVFGSIGYVAASLCIGRLIGLMGLGVVPAALAALLFVTALVCLCLSGPAVRKVAPAVPGHAIGRAGIGLLVVCFLQLASFGGYYGFYSLFLASQGYGEGAIGVFWSLGVLAEIAFFYAAAPLVRRVAPFHLLVVALGVTLARWLVLAAFPHSTPLLVLAQIAHLAGFALFHTLCVLLAPRLLKVGAERAQALVSAAGWGAGIMVGSLVAGRVWDAFGPRAVYLASAGLAALALMVAATVLRDGALGPAGLTDDTLRETT